MRLATDQCHCSPARSSARRLRPTDSATCGRRVFLLARCGDAKWPRGLDRIISRSSSPSSPLLAKLARGAKLARANLPVNQKFARRTILLFFLVGPQSRFSRAANNNRNKHNQIKPRPTGKVGRKCKCKFFAARPRGEPLTRRAHLGSAAGGARAFSASSRAGRENG